MFLGYLCCNNDQNTLFYQCLIIKVMHMKGSLSQIYLKVYWWASIGLVLSGATALWISQMQYVQAIFEAQRWMIAMIVIVEIILVMWLMRRFNDMTVTATHGSYFLFAALNGFVISVICDVYDIGTIYMTFFITAGMFATMATFSFFASIAVINIYAITLMGLIGVVLLMITGLFADIAQIDYVVTIIMIAIFTLLTAYNVQPITKDCQDTVHKIDGSCDCGLRGAMRLYVSMIYSLLTVLRISRHR